MAHLWSYLLFASAIVQGAVSEAGYYAIIGRDGRPVREITSNPREVVMFNCSVLSGGPADHIKWKRHSTVLLSSPGPLMWLNYTLLHVSEKDSGSYRCIVKRNGAKVSGVSRVSLHVNARPQITLRTSSPQFKYIGDTGTFQCYATGRPRPSFQWKFNNITLKDGDLGNSVVLIQKDQGLELWIGSFGRQHEGMFTCEATNSLGSATFVVQSLVRYRAFEVPPKVIVKKPRVRVNSGSQAELKCKVDYGPQCDRYCSVVWKNNGSVLRNNKKYSVTNKSNLTIVGNYYAKYEINSKLEIIGVLKKDAGLYTCQVFTDLGSGQGQVELQVRDQSDTAFRKG